MTEIERLYAAFDAASEAHTAAASDAQGVFAAAMAECERYLMAGGPGVAERSAFDAADARAREAYRKAQAQRERRDAALAAYCEAVGHAHPMETQA